MILARAVLYAALSACGVTAYAQSYPFKPIRLVVPFSAGGGTDIVSRALGERMSETLGQPIVVNNKGGAGGVIGTDIAAKAPSDGYTLLMASAANAANAALVRDLPHDFLRDFTPVTLVVMSPYLLVVHPSVAKSVPDLIALARRAPGKLNYATSGIGSSQHFTSVMFEQMTGTQTVHVPYKGASAAFADLIAGRVQMFFSAIPGVLPHVKSGKLRGLAVSSATRAAGLPDVPTVAESGVPGFDMSGWYGMLAPRGIAPAHLQRLNTAATEALARADLKALLIGMGLNPVGNSSAEYAAFLKREFEKYAKLARVARIEAK